MTLLSASMHLSTDPIHAYQSLSTYFSFFYRHIIPRCYKKQVKFNPRPDPKSSCGIEVPDIEMLPRNNNGNIGGESRALSVQSCFVSLPEMVEVVPKSRSVLW